MKTRNIAALTIAIFVLTGLIAFAQMGGMGGQPQSPQQGGMSGAQQGGMTGTQQGSTMGQHHSEQMMTGQMMGVDMMHQMSTVMHQMNKMIQNMSRAMEKKHLNDPAHMQGMSKIMGEMSSTMNEMAGQMAKGNMEAADMQNLQERIRNANQMMQRLENQK